MDPTPHVTDAATAELEDWGPLEEATGPEMTTSGLEVWVDGDVSGGIWQCTPGPSYWTQEEHEVIHLIAGRMTVTPDGGETVELGAGRHGRVPEGLVRDVGHPRDRAQGLRALLRADNSSARSLGMCAELGRRCRVRIAVRRRSPPAGSGAGLGGLLAGAPERG